MRTYPECFGCILQQALSVMDIIGVDQETQIHLTKEVLMILGRADDQITPPELYIQAHNIVRTKIGEIDPYADMKKNSHQIAMNYLDDLRDLINQGDDKFEQGLKVSAAGNIIDVVHAREYHLWEEVESTVSQDLDRESVEIFRERIQKAPYLLYLADNVGETVFDRVFIELLDIPVIYAVKSGPILNDATLEDALAAGIDQLAEIVETGSRAPGTILSQCTDEFLQIFNESSLVLSKGQANYETLDDQGDKVFFLLRMKCPILCRELKSPHGSLVLRQGTPID